MLAIAIALLVNIGTISQKPPPQTPYIQTQENPNGSVGKQQYSQSRQPNSGEQPPTPPEIIPQPSDGKRKHNAEESGEEGTEFWPSIFGYRLKVTDTLLALFTFGLFAVTWRLWISTRNLVIGAERIAERQLRAYVLCEDTYFIYKGEHRTDAPDREFTDIQKTRIKNFGQTPAFDMSVWLYRSTTEIVDTNVNNLLVKVHSEQSLAPGHRYGPNFPIEDEFRHTKDFFFYGKVVYRDIYQRWWITCFSWQYQPKQRFRPCGMHYGEEGPFKTKPDWD